MDRAPEARAGALPRLVSSAPARAGPSPLGYGTSDSAAARAHRDLLRVNLQEVS